jgi:hypothetical protein
MFDHDIICHEDFWLVVKSRCWFLLCMMWCTRLGLSSTATPEFFAAKTRKTRRKALQKKTGTAPTKTYFFYVVVPSRNRVLASYQWKGGRNQIGIVYQKMEFISKSWLNHHSTGFVKNMGICLQHLLGI